MTATKALTLHALHIQYCAGSYTHTIHTSMHLVLSLWPALCVCVYYMYCFKLLPLYILTHYQCYWSNDKVAWNKIWAELWNKSNEQLYVFVWAAWTTCVIEALLKNRNVKCFALIMESFLYFVPSYEYIYIWFIYNIYNSCSIPHRTFIYVQAEGYKIACC